MNTAMHGLLSGRRRLSDLGTMELYWDLTLPTATVDTPGHNTVDTSGSYTSFTKVMDLSGKGRVGTVPNKTNAPRVNGASGAQFLAAQYFNTIADATVVPRTILLVLDGAVTGGTAEFNIIGTFENSLSGSLAMFGNYGSAITGETFSFIEDQKDKHTFYNIPLNAFNTMAFGSNMIMVNGVDTVVNGVTLLATMGTLRYQLGKRISAGQYFTGNVRKVLIYSTALTVEQAKEATLLINQ